MSPEAFAEKTHEHPGARLTGVYTRALCWYLLGVIVLWLLGIEGIYAHPTPFYALPAAAFDTLLPPLTLAILAGLAYVAGSGFYVDRSRTRTTLGYLGCLALAALLVWVFYQQFSAQSQPWQAAARDYLEVVRWHVLAFGVFSSGLAALGWSLPRVGWFAVDAAPTARETRWMIAAIVVFAIAFACAVAMLRGGSQGIYQAYERTSYEYIGDIGVGGSIKGLFARYNELRPHLSMHAKVHPPGPIAVLWILSYVAGRGALALSLATVLVGTLGIVPLYGWARDLTNRRVALTTCLIYSVIPAIVLFTATSADILFMPFTLTTLFLFTRAIERPSAVYAFAAGAGFGIMAILKFSLLGFGAYFAFTGLYHLYKHRAWWAVVQTAAVMLGAFLLFHLALRAWSGYDIIANFQAAKDQFILDQHHLDEASPRLPSWTWKILNPMAWFYFAGIPVSLLALWRIVRPDPAHRALWIVFALTLLALDFLYLARGEGERSALYIFPLLALPAAHALDAIGQRRNTATPLLATVAFLAFQCWLTESYFYTYW
ncbi:MAG: glycosyltransferase family 39 protein [Candidatus Hydrogenedentota bacterium]